MSGHRGMSGPLTLRCSACGRRNCGVVKHIIPTGRTRRKTAEVQCACGWTWFTTHPSARPDRRRH